MAVYLPTLKQLQYLVALRDTGHFGRAADACFVTQSTLSAGLRELESLLTDRDLTRVVVDPHVLAAGHGINRGRTLDRDQAGVDGVAKEHPRERASHDRLHTGADEAGGRLLTGAAAAEVGARDDHPARVQVGLDIGAERFEGG